MDTGLGNGIGNIGSSPSMTNTLVITIFKSREIGVATGSINYGGQENWSYGYLSPIGKKGLEKDVPIFGNHVNIPITDRVNQLIGRGVTRVVKEKTIRGLDAGNMNDITEGANNANRGGNIIDIVVPKNR